MVRVQQEEPIRIFVELLETQFQKGFDDFVFYTEKSQIYKYLIIIQFFHDQRSEEYFDDMQTGRYSISEQQIGKATVGIPTIKKSEAQRQVTRDEQELEQGIVNL